MTDIHLDILDDVRKPVFLKLKACTPQGVLGGGTALALQLNHRKSYDFDIFVPKAISAQVYRNVSEVFQESPQKLVDSADQLTVLLSSSVELTFLYYWYQPLYPLIQTSGLPLYDKRDIATDKAVTIGRRNVWRDYVDFYFLFHDKHITMEQLCSDAEKRFGNEFSSKLFLAQLSYFADVKDQAIHLITSHDTKEDMQTYLQTLVTSYSKSYLSK